MRKIYFILPAFFLTLSLFIFSCNKTETLPDATPFNYYPLQTGKYITYQCDSIKYTDYNADTVSFQAKEMIVDTFYDNTGRLNYRIQRFIRPNDTVDWVTANVWSAMDNLQNKDVEKIENNLRFVKLVTPVSNSTEWAGNTYLGGLESIPVSESCDNLAFLENWNYNYSNVQTPVTINGLNFDNTVTVEQTGDINLIEYNFAKEIYADGVGMISKEFYHYTNDQVPLCDTCTWHYGNILCGYSITMKVIDWQ